MSEIELQLSKQADEIRDKCRTRGPLNREKEPGIFSYLLAAKFNEGLKSGGFGKVIHDSRGNNLKEREDMLLESGAKRTHDYFVLALKKCITSSEAYAVFMARAYGERGSLHDTLQLHSLDYFSEPMSFVEEIGPWLGTMAKTVDAWLAE